MPRLAWNLPEASRCMAKQNPSSSTSSAKVLDGCPGPPSFHCTHFSIGCFSLPQMFLPQDFCFFSTLWWKCFWFRFCFIIQTQLNCSWLRDAPTDKPNLGAPPQSFYSCSLFFMTYITICYLLLFSICLLETSHTTNPELSYQSAFSKHAHLQGVSLPLLKDSSVLAISLSGSGQKTQGTDRLEIGIDIYKLLYIKSLEKGNDYPCQCSCLENSMDKEGCGLQSMSSQRIGHISNKGPTIRHKELSTL